MAWWNHLTNSGPPPVIQHRRGVRPVTPKPEPAPLQLTKAMMLKPTAAQWKRANDMFEHPHGCRCSTCRLVAELAVMIKIRDQFNAT
jgi:hypothetical protein